MDVATIELGKELPLVVEAGGKRILCVAETTPGCWRDFAVDAGCEGIFVVDRQVSLWVQTSWPAMQGILASQAGPDWNLHGQDAVELEHVRLDLRQASALVVHLQEGLQRAKTLLSGPDKDPELAREQVEHFLQDPRLRGL